ncbi:hypothetical protein G6011_08752 [Alternaria panax]|uniref:Zinc knuckle-domain-containing protein n=1 Tax=Alternaria panax TaxID=48097 RepID=A0AAD4IA10_9PLEO|nr:hypothetical protein G6011_08752 [Alternaria panax]
MFRRPGAGRSQASADTLCQKCLKRGHYSYECKASAQERPYKSRPSRTQQLLNPKLKPKLTTEVPEDLLRKKGVADDILKKKEEDRKRARSLSISSADSVSTISTNRSRSRSCSRSPPRRTHDGPRHRANDDKAPPLTLAAPVRTPGAKSHAGRAAHTKRKTEDGFVIVRIDRQETDSTIDHQCRIPELRHHHQRKYHHPFRESVA